MALLDVTNLSRSFGGLAAVNNVSFSLERSRIKALIGPNGAGKTTLFNMISGVLRPDTGHASFRDSRLDRLKPHQIARLGISRTFQNPSLFAQMSVLENVMCGRHARTTAGFWACGLRLPRQRKEESLARDHAMARLEYVGLSHLGALPAGSLAFGQRRMVELARALASEPQLLLLDEPASGLNTREKQDLSELIANIRAAGVTVLIVEHDMSMVMRLSDEVVVLDHGAVIAEGTPAEIQVNEEVVRVYLGGDTKDVAPGS